MTIQFLLGTHQPGWLTQAGVPLMVSDRRLRAYKRLPESTVPWALDSGGFTELQQYGRWTVTAVDYAARVRLYRATTGHLTWAAPQDWMCEPIVIAGGRAGRVTFAGTGLNVDEHQRRTVDSVTGLRAIAPDVWWLPVLQGYTVDEYLRCAERYVAAGIDLTAEPLVGLGSVCRRQATGEAEQIITALHSAGITRLHGFGIKTLGLYRYGHLLESADSLAWSDDARRRGRPMPDCPGHRPGCPVRCRAHHKNCANCLRYALRWRSKVLATARPDHGRGVQLDLFAAWPGTAA